MCCVGSVLRVADGGEVGVIRKREQVTKLAGGLTKSICACYTNLCSVYTKCHPKLDVAKQSLALHLEVLLIYI